MFVFVLLEVQLVFANEKKCTPENSKSKVYSICVKAINSIHPFIHIICSFMHSHTHAFIQLIDFNVKVFFTLLI